MIPCKQKILVIDIHEQHTVQALVIQSNTLHHVILLKMDVAYLNASTFVPFI